MCSAKPSRSLGLREEPWALAPGKEASLPTGSQMLRFCIGLGMNHMGCNHRTVNHRMAWVGRDLKDHLVPTSCHRQGCCPLNLIPYKSAPGSIQAGPEHQQGWGIHGSSGQPVPGLATTLSYLLPVHQPAGFIIFS